MSAQASMIKVPGGSHIPFLSDGDGESRPVEIETFLLDEKPVTNLDFLKFIEKNPRWAKSKIASLFSDENYLKHWPSDSLDKQAKSGIGDQPVVNVSWFAAKAYCESQGKRLPKVDEWEYSSDADNKENIKKILKWYGSTNNGEVVSVDAMETGKFGLRGMHGHIWEWVQDFNSVLITQDSRNKPSEKLEGLFCGGGSLKGKDSTDYASFMRHAFRSGLSGQYTYSLLGFRCAKDLSVKEMKEE